jgi:hypothetical protein
MAKQVRHGKLSHNKSKATIAKAALLAWFALLPVSAKAQGVRMAASELPAGDKAPSSASVGNVVTLGTTKEKVDAMLGTPRTAWTINSLRRSFITYQDGTKIIVVDGRVISAVPNGLAVGSPAQGFIVERQGKEIFFEPMVLCGVNLDGPMGDLKRQVEECFFFVFSGRGYPALPPPSPCVPWPCPEPTAPPSLRFRLF